MVVKHGDVGLVGDVLRKHCWVVGWLFGEVEGSDDFGGSYPDDELAGDAVAAAEFFGTVGAYVAGAGARCDVEEFVGVLGEGAGALHLDEAVRRVGVVDAQDDTWIPHQRLAFGGSLSGVEDEITLVDDKPDGGYEGASVLGDKSQHSGPGACGQELDGRGGEFGDGGHAAWRLSVCFLSRRWVSQHGYSGAMLL